MPSVRTKPKSHAPEICKYTTFYLLLQNIAVYKTALLNCYSDLPNMYFTCSVYAGMYCKSVSLRKTPPLDLVKKSATSGYLNSSTAD